VAKRTVKDLHDLKGARLFVRVDFNVPLENGRITDDTRIRAALPTLDYLVKAGARLAVASHLGRPKKGPEPALSLKPVAAQLQDLLGGSVAMAPDCVGPDLRKMAEGLRDGGVLLLENVRFHKEEEANDPRFAGRLVADTMSTVFVNDAFGTAHRAHASTEGVSHHVSRSVAGFLMEKELRYLGMARDAPDHPYVAVLGGAKVSDKIEVIESLLPKVDSLLVGGGMAYTFLRAEGLLTGKSLVEEDKVHLAQRLLEKAGPKLRLPMDHVVAAAFKEDAERRVLPVDQIPPDWMGLDIGPATVKAYTDTARPAKLVFWNGPMGVFEMKPFAEGTLAMARALADSAGTSIVGGGDSVAAVTQMGLADKIDHVSTGGGASLEFLGGAELPGVACLENADAGA
jgi:phosphoglycerate kinase